MNIGASEEQQPAGETAGVSRAAQVSPPTIEGFAGYDTEVNGVKLHYALGGDPLGAPVLLWHGFLGTSYTWRRVAPALAQAGLSVLVPDMRGYGDSDKPAGTAGYDGRNLAEDFRALVDQIQFGNGRPLTVVAHDMGAPPALLWAADHPEEIATLFYLDEPVLLVEVLSKIIVFTPETMTRGSLWWWLLPHAPNACERLFVGNERALLTWFYDRDPSSRDAVEPEAVEEYLRTFSGEEGVLGALGVYRAVFETMDQTAALKEAKVEVPIVALGGERANGARVRRDLNLVATNVDGGVVPDVGHFLPEEVPEEIVRHILESTAAQNL
jgi:pimeloyl-ACP methyl ester carboxylesterase